jgi:hypothetical protein
MHGKCGHLMDNGFILKEINENVLKREKDPGVCLRSTS